ncbi:hypothetical protein DPMN_116687 [Dreissena polymorpha]|uniref:Uncharacterized protein n=1 Tax=Dreissena polymorpha TaxID=45954 RepID=A0A9D4KPW6_DREPO|nr:hypothetical protein DPMN_116687 [Dreissena polymorpha]
MQDVFQQGDFNLPQPSTLASNVNRARAQHRPKEPDSLDFEVGGMNIRMNERSEISINICYTSHLRA